ncbi:NACHT, LRR and PYD domains-containing protein 3-like [Chanos chanos]|uniref:NACHT, LRR and PYD domains-containing protein 3-like n=1 Tax=Chanos chanos TaxID=29144 RepID=A0A6J2VDK6_CHACN|nr:NACHT, LRR and PYD domains-containing protein 3-like [Chanos chanos]
MTGCKVCIIMIREFDEQLDGLLSFLHSVPGLKEVHMTVWRLTESYAARILSLIQTCPSLQDISFKAVEYEEGLLLEEGIRLLQHSQIRPDCTLTVEGLRCTKPTDQCTKLKHRKLTCNQRVKLQFYLTSVSIKYKELVRCVYAYVTEYNSLPGENVLLADRYTELLIIQRHREQSERETEIRSRGEQFFSARDSEKYSSITVDQFFCPDDHGLIPKAVVLQGNSGNGKSFTALKIMLDWASGKFYADNFDFIFHLKCKEMNQISGEKSLVELLRYSQSLTPAQISQILQHSPERVLFLIDGFDELKLSQDNMSNLSLPTDIQTPASPVSTLKALMSGHLLSESFLLVTTRSTATDTLSKLLKKQPQRFTEIMGFSERGVEEFFQRFFKDDQLLQTQAYEHVKANETLFTACFIPVICWIICTVFRERHKDGIVLKNESESTTSIYVDFVSTLLDHHCQGLSQSVPSLLRSLGQLAERGMVEQQVLFDKKSVSEIVSDPVNIPFLCKFLFKRKIRQETMFSFMHLSFQEFFTALYYVLMSEEESQKAVRNLLQSLDGAQHELKKNAKLHLLPVIQFLCGLSNKEVSNSLTEANNLPVSPTIKALLKKWILPFDRSRNQPAWGIFILHCLYELHDEDFVRKAMESWGNINLSCIPLKRTDCWVLQYCLQFCPHIRRLFLKRCGLTPEKLKILQPAVCRSEMLELEVEDLSDDDVGVLVSALGHGKDLRQLKLVNSVLSDHSVQQVLSSLNKQRSLGFVSLTVKIITTSTAVMITEFFRDKTIMKKMSVMVKNSIESLCSSLRVSVTQGDFCLSLGEAAWNSSEISSPQTEPSLSGISLTCPHSQISNINWNRFIQIIYKIKLSNENCPEFDVQFNALLSFLNSVPGLKEVDLTVNRLTESWAARILSLIQTCPSLQDISVEVNKNSVENLCSSLRVSVTNGDFSCPEFDEQFDALLSFLNSVSGLKEVDLYVNGLTESWAARILSLIQTCPSLQDISYST